MTATAAAASSSSVPFPAPPTLYPARSKAPVRSVIPHKIALALLTPNNVGQLRKLNSVLFPVRFSDRWYKDVLQKDVADICKLALFNDIPVGNICCRYEREGSSEVKVYIMTLGVLAPYRRLGVASELLRHLLSVAGVGTSISLPDPNAPLAKAPSSTSSNSKTSNNAQKNAKDAKAGSSSAKTEESKRENRTVKSLYLHVQTSNDDAKAFYESQGFKHTSTVEDYYKVGIEPRSAWVLERFA